MIVNVNDTGGGALQDQGKKELPIACAALRSYMDLPRATGHLSMHSRPRAQGLLVVSGFPYASMFQEFHFHVLGRRARLPSRPVQGQTGSSLPCRRVQCSLDAQDGRRDGVQPHRQADG